MTALLPNPISRRRFGRADSGPASGPSGAAPANKFRNIFDPCQAGCRSPTVRRAGFSISTCGMPTRLQRRELAALTKSPSQLCRYDSVGASNQRAIAISPEAPNCLVRRDLMTRKKKSSVPIVAVVMATSALTGLAPIAAT